MQAGALAGLPGGLRDRAARPGKAVGPARGAGGSPPPAEDAEARSVGSARPGVPELPGEEAAARLRRGSFELVPECGHLPHVERPDLFVAALEGFLARCAPPVSPRSAPGQPTRPPRV